MSGLCLSGLCSVCECFSFNSTVGDVECGVCGWCLSGWCLSEWMLFELAGRCLNTLDGNWMVFKRDGRCLSELDGV